MRFLDEGPPLAEFHDEGKLRVVGRNLPHPLAHDERSSPAATIRRSLGGHTKKKAITAPTAVKAMTGRTMLTAAVACSRTLSIGCLPVCTCVAPERKLDLSTVWTRGNKRQPIHFGLQRRNLAHNLVGSGNPTTPQLVLRAFEPLGLNGSRRWAVVNSTLDCRRYEKRRAGREICQSVRGNGVCRALEGATRPVRSYRRN